MTRFGTWIGGLIGILVAVAVEAVQIDINNADAALMAAEIGGLGIGRAEAIVRHREKHGPFTSVEQLSNVPGISKRIIDNNRGHLTAGNPAGKAAAPKQ